MNERRKARTWFKVIHRHQIGSVVLRRVSELVFMRDRPMALLEWINLGGVRTPLYICELDPLKLRPASDARGTYHYDAVTVDPRFQDVADQPTDLQNKLTGPAAGA